MTNMIKSKRTVTVDSSSVQDDDKPSRRQSVFDRLGPGALPAGTKERNSERQEKCRNWLRKGECAYGNLCKYEHRPLINTSKHGREKGESSEYRKKSKSKRNEEISRSPSPLPSKHKRDKQGLSSSQKSKLDYEIKLRSTIVKPKSPENERFEKYSKIDSDKKGSRRSKKEIVKKPLEQQWEEDEQEDSDDWDAMQLDYKEALTLEMKRQELQRELEIELRKEEAMMKNNGGNNIDNVVISKQVASSSSSSSSSSRSSSASSSSVSSSSSSSSSDSGSDSDSSGSTSGSSTQNKKASRAHKKSQSISPQRRKYKRSHYAHGRSSPSAKSSSKISSKGPRTPSPTKSNRQRNEYETAEFNRGDGRGRGKQKNEDDEERKRYSVSPPTSYASSDFTNRDRSHKKADDKRGHRKSVASISPPRSYSSQKRDRSESSKSQNQSSNSAHKRGDQHARYGTPTRDRHVKNEPERHRRGRSPAAYSNRKDNRQRSQTPKDSHSDKTRSEKRQSISPSKVEQSSHREHRSREVSGKSSREDGRQRLDQYLPNRSRNNNGKTGRYSNYYEEPDVRQRHSSRSPDRQLRRDFRDVPMPPHDRLPPHAEPDTLLHDRRKDKVNDNRGMYGTDSPLPRRVYDDEFSARDARGYRDPEYQRVGVHERDYLPPDPLRERDLAYRSIDGHREPPYLADLPPRERDYGRHEFHDREYYSHDLAYGHRDNVGRAYVGHMDPEDRRRDPVYDIPGRERLRERYVDPRDRVNDRDRYPPVIPPEELEHHSHRRQRQGPYLPEEEPRGKRDWAPPYPEYSDLAADRYGYCRVDYPLEPGAQAHGWDQRPRESERDNRDLYYGGRHHPRLEADEGANKRRQGNSPSFPGSGWDMPDYRGKRGYAPNDRDHVPRRERERERARDKDQGGDSARDHDRSKDGDRSRISNREQERERQTIANRGEGNERRGHKRERSRSSERNSEHHPEKRSRDERKPELEDGGKGDGYKSREQADEGARGDRDRRQDVRRDDRRRRSVSATRSQRSNNSRSRNRGNSRDRTRNSAERRAERIQVEPDQNREGVPAKDDNTERSTRDGDRSRSGRSRNSDDYGRRRSPDDRSRRGDRHGRSRRSRSAERGAKETQSTKSYDDKSDTEKEKKSETADSRKKWEETSKTGNEGMDQEEGNTMSAAGSDDGDTMIDDGEVGVQGDQKVSELRKTDEKNLETEALKEVKEDGEEPQDTVLTDASGSRSSPTLKKVVADDKEVVPEGLNEETVVDACKGSDSDDNKENEEELSEWSDGDDDLLTRDEVVDQNDEEQESDKMDATITENIAKPNASETLQKSRRIEEIKADHGRKGTSSRSSSSDRQYRDRSNRSLSSERSRGSREGSRERLRNRDRGRNRGRGNLDSYKDRERSSSYSSRSSSRNESIDRNRSDVNHRKVTKDEKSSDKSATDQSKSKDEASSANIDNFDYDPISDDELEAMIEEPAETDHSEPNNTQSTTPGIVDALNVDWASLMGGNERLTEKPIKTKATQRFKPGKIFSQLGFSVSLLTPELAAKIKKVCNEELEKEMQECGDGSKPAKFELKHDIAALHAAAISQKEERDQILTDIGPYRRALCARQDLQIRRKLCRFHHRLPDHLSSAVSTTQHNTDPELYQLSVQLFKNAQNQPEIVF